MKGVDPDTGVKPEIYDKLLKKKIQEMHNQLTTLQKNTSVLSATEDNQAANGPLVVPEPPEIMFEPSGNAPEIDLGAPDYDKDLAERRRKQFLTM